MNTGNENTAVGTAALLFNTASGNTAVGSRTLLNNTTGGTLGNIQGVDVASLAVRERIIADSNVAVADGVINESLKTNRRVAATIGVIHECVVAKCTVGDTNAGGIGQSLKTDSRAKHSTRSSPSASATTRSMMLRRHLPFGLIAEEVAEVYPDLVGRNPKGEPESVHYDQVNAMLLNEFLKEHTVFIKEQRKVKAQGRKILEQEARSRS